MTVTAMVPRSSAIPLALAVVVLAAFGISFLLSGGTPPGPGAGATAAAPQGVDPVRGKRRERAPSLERATSGRELFAHACGMCHTLRASGMRGMFGPDLDKTRPSEARVRRMIRTGSIDGVMQPDLLRGAEARRVAAYVARVAGTRDR